MVILAVPIGFGTTLLAEKAKLLENAEKVKGFALEVTPVLRYHSLSESIEEYI